jgi:hypothetical protein
MWLKPKQGSANEPTWSTLPHGSSVLERVGSGLHRPVEVGVDLVASAARLVQEGKLEEGAHVGAAGDEGDEDGDVGSVVLGVLAVGVEVDSPVVASDGEDVAGEVVAGAHALGEGETLDGVVVGAPHCVGDVARPRRRRCHRIRQPNPRWVGLRQEWSESGWGSALVGKVVLPAVEILEKEGFRPAALPDSGGALGPVHETMEPHRFIWGFFAKQNNNKRRWRWRRGGEGWVEEGLVGLPLYWAFT